MKVCNERLCQGAHHSCTAGEKLEIRFDGKVLPCAAFKDNDAFILGDIRHDTLETCLQRAKHHPLLRAMKIVTGQTPFKDIDDYQQAYTLVETHRRTRPTSNGIPLAHWKDLGPLSLKVPSIVPLCSKP